eukprot:TRINITY_DN17370_c0_g1_i1.p2 TRINITY_DN17370_c0_g1~~TRINITY_DN17370_c0_g1_i1.p2  ORF type:complete len:150 (-),score=45.89 TRINITY_DN17370_c0_g1_i1:1007-1456(-)
MPMDIENVRKEVIEAIEEELEDCDPSTTMKILLQTLEDNIGKKRMNLVGREFAKQSIKDALARKAGVKESKKRSVSAVPDGDSYYYPLDGDKRVTISKFKGTKLIQFRKYYRDASGTMKPGKQGIALKLAEFEQILELADDIKETYNSV